MDEFASALMLSEWDDEDLGTPSPEVAPPEASIQQALNSVPEGGDRLVVDGALRTRVHVLLTRDKRLARAAPTLSTLGLRVLSPLDLLEELFACGAFHCLLGPEYGYWAIPDLQRMSHLIQALPEPG